MTKADHILTYLVRGTLMWACVGLVGVARQALADYRDRARFQLWYLRAGPDEVRALLEDDSLVRSVSRQHGS